MTRTAVVSEAVRDTTDPMVELVSLVMVTAEGARDESDREEFRAVLQQPMTEVPVQGWVRRRESDPVVHDLQPKGATFGDG